MRPVVPFTNNARRWTEVQGAGWIIFLRVLIRCNYMKYSRHHFLLIIKNIKKTTTGRWHARNTSTQIGSSRIFKRMVPVYDCCEWKKKYQELFLLRVSNSFASLLSQTSILVHSSHHLSTWSPSFTSHDLRCRSLVSRAKLSSSSA